MPNFPAARYGGTLIRSQPADPPTWDSWLIQTENAHNLLETVLDSVIAYDPYKQDRIVPQLAESWTVAADALTYTFKVRKGVRFQNGDALTAEDLRWSLDQIKNAPPSAPSFMAGLLVSVGSIAAPDEQTLVVRLKQPDASFLAGIAHGKMHVMSKKFIAAQGRPRAAAWPPIGTGPYSAKPGSYSRGVSYEAVKNPDYWVKGRPFLNGMKFFIIPDAGTDLAAFLSGQINFGIKVSPVQEKEIRSRMGDKAVLQRTPSTVTWNLYLDIHNPPFNNARLREAVALALDKRAMIEGGEQGLGAIGGMVIPQTGFELSEADLKAFAGYSGDHAADLKKARQLLTEAGFPNGLSSKIFTRNNPNFPAKAIVAKANLEDIGIKAEIELSPDAVYYDKRLDLNTWDIAIHASRYAGTDPNFAFNQYWLTGAELNFSKFSDPKVDELYVAQNRESDPAKRKAVLNDLEKRVLGSYANLMLYFRTDQFAWDSRIKNFSFHINLPGNLQMRDVWME